MVNPCPSLFRRQFAAGCFLRRSRRGFTLVELLVVIAIIGVLVALLMPAVQSAREAARRLQCSNNLKQWGMGMLNHEQSQGWLPTGGWGWFWVGDPDKGYDMSQSGGWLYNTLPYVEQAPLHDLGLNSSASVKQQAVLTMVHTPLAIANCPTRRRNALFAKPSNGTFVCYNAGSVSNDASNNVAARTDYAANTGSNALDEYWGGPGSDPGTVTAPWHNVKVDCTGISFECSMVRMAHIKDGSSNTLMLGEKYIGADWYSSGSPGSDNESMYVGMDNDINRTTASPPRQDTSGYDNSMIFGSARAAGCNFVFCDGSVHRLSFTIDPTTFWRLGNRADGQAIDPSLVR